MSEVLTRLGKGLFPLTMNRADIPVRGYQPPNAGSDYQPGRKAAVLVPIVNRSQSLSVLFTRRSGALNLHAGQVSFPGGSIEAGDRTGIDTALRESQEEIGLDPGFVTPLGLLDFFDTVSNFRVLPVVALVDPRADIAPDMQEVDVVFQVPLSDLQQPERFQRYEVVRDGRRYHYHSYRHGEHNIWGVTAEITLDLIGRL